eukprot:c10179_g1_i1.p1 GENE.c10179_g1_i1~~c10179_g1_i1.p1  ORF type:complete len:251 (+),score=71.39 c10179_g1_i1:103-753(+)
MPIVYAVVSRGATVLAEFAATSGNFVIVTRRILEKIAPKDGKMSYEYDSYLFHYIVEQGLIYLCIAEKQFSRRSCFMFLEDIKQRFVKQYSESARNSLAYGMNEEFSRVLQKQMDYYSTFSHDRVMQVKEEIDEVKGIMVSNIEKVMDRGEKIDLLVGKTENLNQQAFRFKKESKSLHRALWLKNIKMNMLIFLLVIVILMAIVMGVCGVTFKHCK